MAFGQAGPWWMAQDFMPVKRPRVWEDQRNMPRLVQSATNIMRDVSVEATVRVRWGECDLQGHAYYASYIPWFDLGREKFALDIGADYRKYQIATTDLQVRYHAAAKYLDDLVVKTWAATPGTLTYYYEIYRKRGGQLIAEARTVHAFVDPERGVLTKIPDDMHHAFVEFLENRRQNKGKRAVEPAATTSVIARK
ncbi:acyl-CoA thioesterase [Streptomyces sp. ISL-22]|uniref:acyl-CoA thioesterase n=1 Tax=unclassified Streptomyces TaxID=2593676 RepID=UPI001BEA4A4F|nr:MULTISPECIES: thioesterase family protein [unclassified Streptomyces]MBT2418866.1 acyl-CoA thioesterase [Streptomyces sp. ISL-24]MBT2435701.1 acyl-CoA thioesterase [Streptomyces sp. ISL-22]